MRLTLRTLLAWLDGVLQETERESLAAKVAASAVVPRLINRIKEVMANPGLPAPSPDGGGLADDATSVAAFLDNSLPLERLEAFERTCLESEIHLADVAECHAILAELTRDPNASASMDSDTQAAILQVLQRAIDDAAPVAGHGDVAALGKLVREATGAAAKPVAPRSRFRSKASFGAWLSVVAATVLVFVLGGLLVRQIWPPSARVRDVATRDAGNSAITPQIAAPSPETVPPKAPAQEVVAATAGDAGRGEQSPSPPVLDHPATGGEPPSEQNGPANATVVAPADPVVVPLPSMETETPTPPGGQPEPEQPVIDHAPPAPGMSWAVVSGGPLLHRGARGTEALWRAVGAGMPLSDGEEIVVPVHVYPQLVRGDVLVRLLPGTRCLTSIDRDGVPRIEVVFGRAVMWTEAANARLGITAGGLSGVILLGPRQTVGIGVELTRDRGSDSGAVPPGVLVTMYCNGGGLWCQTESDGSPRDTPLAGMPLELPIPPRGGLLWDSAAAGAGRIMPPSSEPDWMMLTGPSQRLDRLAASAVARAVAVDLPAAEALEIMADSRRVEERMAAAATLALLGNYGPLVEALCEESPARRLREREWITLEASTVPLALARGGNAAAALRQAFEAHGPAGRAAELFLLARGVSATELSEGGAEGLVNSLEDSALVIRRYALSNLLAIVPDADVCDYRPDRPRTLNAKGVAWWRERIAAGLSGRGADARTEP